MAAVFLWCDFIYNCWPLLYWPSYYFRSSGDTLPLRILGIAGWT